MPRTRHQEGSVKENGDQWQGHFYVYDEQGERHHKSRPLGPRTGAQKLSKWQAKEKLREIIERETGKPFAPRSAAKKSGPKDGTVAWFWLERFAPFKSWAPRTRRGVEGNFRLHVLPVLGETKLNELDKYQVQLLLQGLGHYSHSMVRKVKVYLREMMDEAVEQGLVTRNPVRSIKAVGGKPATKRYLTFKEFDLIMGELKFRDRLICTIAFVLGLRPGELFALKWDDFDAANLRLRIDETVALGEWKPTKTEKSNGWVTMSASVRKDILSWREMNPSPSALMFPNRNNRPIDTHSFLQNIIKAASRRAGIMPARPKGLPKWARWCDKTTAVTFQSMRRACATHLQAIGGDIKATQAHLRHVSPQTTLEYYIESVPEATQAAVNKFSAAMNKTRPAPTAEPLSVQ